MSAPRQTRQWFLSTATMLPGGVCKCDECDEVLLEDERHWHRAAGSTYQVLASHPLKPSVGVMMETHAGASRIRRALKRRGYRVTADVWENEEDVA